MWLLPDQVARVLRECGLGEASAAVPEAWLAVEIEPGNGVVRLRVAQWQDSPPDILRTHSAAVTIDPRYGLWDNQSREVMVKAGFRAWTREAPQMLRRLWEVFREYELLLLETGLSRGEEGFCYARGRMLCDDNAIDRNERLERFRDPVAGEPAHAMKAHGIDYVELRGEIGLLSVGAGETMATMDLLDASGGRAACFMDCSGGFGADAVTAALRRACTLPGVRVMLVNIFGGVTRVDGVAESILAALERIPGFPLPLVIRLEGTGASRGRELLAAKGLPSHTALRDAVEAAVALAGQGAA